MSGQIIDVAFTTSEDIGVLGSGGGSATERVGSAGKNEDYFDDFVFNSLQNEPLKELVQAENAAELM